MTLLRTRLLALLIAAVAALGAAAPAMAQDGGGDNAAVAVNTKDDSSVFKFAFDVRRTMSDVIDETNAAVAFASCEDCQTIAIAIQIVLVMGDPEVVTPENLALALNVDCTSCETLASAYQFVFGTDGRVKFTSEAWRRLIDIRKALHDLGKSDASIEEVQTEVDRLANELREVLRTGLEPVGRPEEESASGDSAESQEATPEPEPSEPSEPAPEAEVTPEPTPEATPTTSPEPTPEPTP